MAVDMINANGNANHLSADGEIARWNVESGLILNSKASPLPFGVPDSALLTKELNTYADIGLFDGVVPDISTILDDSVVKGLYDDNAKVIWPST
jgi:hypothetical protein